jgi:hypothetical protein
MPNERAEEDVNRGTRVMGIAQRVAIEKAKGELGLQTRICVDTGMDRCVEWIKTLPQLKSSRDCTWSAHLFSGDHVAHAGGIVRSVSRLSCGYQFGKAGRRQVGVTEGGVQCVR